MAHDIVIVKMRESKKGGRFTIVRLSLTEIPEVERAVLGGRGLNSAILWSLRRDIPDHWKSGKNVVVIGAGPFTGSDFPSTGRTTISVLKSPVTGFWSDGNLGGYFGAALRRARIAAIVLVGKMTKPHIIHINKTGLVRLIAIEETRFYSLGTKAAEGWIRSDFCDPKNLVSTLSIGTAGAKGVFCSTTMSGDRAAGGGGTGAVIGSKKIKAISVEYDEDTNSIDFVSNTSKHEFKRISDKAEDKIKSHPVFDMFSKYGTTSLIEIHAALEYLPINNWNRNVDTRWDQVSGQKLRDNLSHFYEGRLTTLEKEEERQKEDRIRGCSNCPICCSSIGKIEYETLNCLGPKIGVFDLDWITSMNALYMNDAGLDVIQSTSIIAALMDMWNDLVLHHPMEWGDKTMVQQFLQELTSPDLEEFPRTIAHYFVNGFYEGILRILNENPFYFDQIRFEETIQDDFTLNLRLNECETKADVAQLLTDVYYVHSKGYGLSGVYINDKNKGVAIAAATSTRGADHLRSLPTLATYADWYLGGKSSTSLWEKFKSMLKMPFKALWIMKAEQKNLVGDLYQTYETTFGVPNAVAQQWKDLGFLHDKNQVTGWGSMLKFCQEMYAVSDSLGTCKFTSTWRFGVGPEILSEALTHAWNHHYTWSQLMECGERVTALERQLLFYYDLNTKVIDDIPQKFYDKNIKDPLTRSRMRELLTDYYDWCGFNEDGTVREYKMTELFSQKFEQQLDILHDYIVNKKEK